MRPVVVESSAVPCALALPARLTHGEARETLAAVVKAVRDSAVAEVRVDARALTVFDTSALAVLLEGRREALSARKTFQVHGLPDALCRMARLYGVEDLLLGA